MADVRGLLELERSLEREFVAADRPNPRGWSAAVTMFHLLKWRERMCGTLGALRDGRPPPKPPENIDEFNDAELACSSRMSLVEAAQGADALLSSLIDLYAAVGDRPFDWFRWHTTTEAVLVNSYTHPHLHLVQYLKENDDLDGAVRLMEKSVSAARLATPPSAILGTEIYNLACLRVAERRHDDALNLLEEAVAIRAPLKGAAPSDPDLAPLRGLERFKAITGA